MKETLMRAAEWLGEAIPRIELALRRLRMDKPTKRLSGLLEQDGYEGAMFPRAGRDWTVWGLDVRWGNYPPAHDGEWLAEVARCVADGACPFKAVFCQRYGSVRLVSGVELSIADGLSELFFALCGNLDREAPWPGSEGDGLVAAIAFTQSNDASLDRQLRDAQSARMVRWVIRESPVWRHQVLGEIGGRRMGLCEAVATRGDWFGQELMDEAWSRLPELACYRSPVEMAGTALACMLGEGPFAYWVGKAREQAALSQAAFGEFWAMAVSEAHARKSTRDESNERWRRSWARRLEAESKGGVGWMAWRIEEVLGFGVFGMMKAAEEAEDALYRLGTLPFSRWSGSLSFALAREVPRSWIIAMEQKDELSAVAEAVRPGIKRRL